MSIALECRDLHKRFVAGVVGCTATVQVLRGIDLVLRAGDGVAIVGPPASGKSTLLLCIAGLVRPDAGEVRWLGDSSRAAAARSVAYYSTSANFDRPGDESASIHLVDAVAAREIRRVSEWGDAHRHRGGVVIVATRDETTAHALGCDALWLRGGRLGAQLRGDRVSRVAEVTV